MNEHFEKLNDIPPGLRAGNLFAGWCTRYDGKRQSKVPVNVQTGRYAHADRPGDWCEFQTAVEALSHSAPGPGFADTPRFPHAAHPLNGIGRLSNYRNDGIIQIDVDNVFEDGQLTAIGREHIEQAGSYAEFSPSGRGLHIFVRARLPAWLDEASSRKVVQKGEWPDAPKFELQLFIRNCYVTVTGDHIASSPLEVVENQEYLDWLLSLDQAAHPLCATVPGRHVANGVETIEPGIWIVAPSPDRVQAAIDDICGKSKIARWLFHGRGKGSASQRDISLCHELIPVCKRDPALIDAVFRQSRLYRPEKWDRMHKNSGRTYGQITIANALRSNPWTVNSPIGSTPKHCELLLNEKCPAPPALPKPEPLTIEEDLKFQSFWKFRANMTRTRQLFLQQSRQGQTDRSHVLALMYQAGALGLGPGKALTLVMRFLDTNHVEVPSLQAEFWNFWEMVCVQVKKTGAQTRAAIEAAYARLLQREQNPETGRRGYGPRTLQAWKLSQQGVNVRQIAEDLGSTEDCVGRLIRRARKYEQRKDFLEAVQSLSIVAPPDDPPEAVEVESEAVTQPEPVLDEIGLAVTQARRRRGHRMKPSSAAFVAQGIREYCAALKIAPDLDIIAAAAEACSPNGKQAVLNAVNNTFARIKAQSMPLIQDLSEVYRAITLRHWGCHFSTRRVVQLSVETLRLVYLETGGNLEAIPWEVLADAVRRSIWPNLVLEHIREWLWNPEVGTGVGSSAEEEPVLSAAA